MLLRYVNEARSIFQFKIENWLGGVEGGRGMEGKDFPRIFKAGFKVDLIV